MKIVVSDFDNTFFDNKFESNIDKINRFVEEGNIFIIATGRNIIQLQNEIHNKSIKCSYYICNDGAIIFDKYLNVIYRKDIDKNIVKSVFDILNSNTNILETYIDTTNGYVTDYNNDCNKIISKPKDRKKAQQLLLELIKKYPSINGYLSDNWININNCNVSKGNAIEYLKKYFNISNNKIYTIGDNINDLSMMQKYNSFAIANNPELECNSKHVVNSFDEFLSIIKSDS